MLFAGHRLKTEPNTSSSFGQFAFFLVLFSIKLPLVVGQHPKSQLLFIEELLRKNRHSTKSNRHLEAFHQKVHQHRPHYEQKQRRRIDPVKQSTSNLIFIHASIPNFYNLFGSLYVSKELLLNKSYQSF